MKSLWLCLLSFAALASLLAGTPLVDQLGITVVGPSRQFAYTNKQAGTYYGEVNARNSGGWQGWYINAEKILDDYSLTIGGKAIDRALAKTTVFPYQLSRVYPDGLEERFTLLDSINAFVVELRQAGTKELPVSMAVQAVNGFIEENNLVRGIKLWSRTVADGDSVVPGWIGILSTKNSRSLFCVVAAARSIEEVVKLAEEIAEKVNELAAARRQRMENLLQASYVETGNHDFNIALMWAKLSLDALIMNQSQSGIPVKGIFAGLPWFNNYWGRDSFISLPGATFVTGNFHDAREILLSFARFQNKDTSSSNYGRIPNIVTTKSIAYNTADGTPWFIKQMYDYVKYSGDTALVRELFPVIVRSIEGTIKYHTDSLGFLTHGDAETWMDAVGPAGPWSPRGNRACEVQALWQYQLMIGAFVADYLTEYRLAGRWQSMAEQVEKNFNKYFVSREKSLVYDHLKADGTPSSELRPNQLFCLDILNSEDLRERIVKSVTANLVYAHGVGTLAASDSNFHPFHHYEPSYVQDAAYHNGIVWTWLNGQATYALTRNDEQDLAFAMTKDMVNQILHRGCVGTLSELLDAMPRQGEGGPRLSGAFSQAWSLAEFVCTFYQDYLGLSVDATSHSIRINPKLPEELGNVSYNFRIGDSYIAASYSILGDSVRVVLQPSTAIVPSSVHYLWVLRNGDAAYLNTTLSPAGNLVIAHSKLAYSVESAGAVISSSRDSSVWYLKNFSTRSAFAGLELARPVFDPGIPSLRGPGYPMLSLEDVRASNSSARILFERNDETGDDKGSSGSYQYPANTNFKPGILDIIHASARFDSTNAYFSLVFRNLTNPGWHPEYGFQLTLAAIAIHRSASGTTHIVANSGYTLDEAYCYDRLITVGGGVRVTDEKGGVICEYLPRPGDEKNPIGNIARNSIEFSIPLRYLGVPTPEWKMTILVGAQDDHGGAGVGEFRSVEKTGGEWIGGGKFRPGDSNIYDVLVLE